MLVTSKIDWVLLCLGLIGTAVCSYLLLFYTPRLSIEGGTVIGKITPKGTIRRRVARSLHWENLSSESTLYLRDIVYAPKDATAHVNLTGGKEFDLLADSMIQLDEVTSDAINITLIDGQVKGPDTSTVVVQKEVKFRMPAYPTRGVSSISTAPAIDAFTLRHSELISRMNDCLRPKTRIIPKPLDKFRKTVVLDKLEYFILKLLKPHNTRYNLRANHWLEFAWTPIPLPGTRYVLELSRLPTFSSHLNHATNVTTVRLQIEEEGTYYWRVRSERSRDIRHSPVWEFNMSLRSGLTQPIPVRIPASTPTGFAVEVGLNPEFSKIVRIQVVQEPKCPRAGLKRGRYYCRIRKVGGEAIIDSYDFNIR